MIARDEIEQKERKERESRELWLALSVFLHWSRQRRGNLKVECCGQRHRLFTGVFTFSTL